MLGKKIKGKSKSKRAMYSNGKLVGGQIKIAKAAPPKNKITGADFKELKKRKA